MSRHGVPRLPLQRSARVGVLGTRGPACAQGRSKGDRETRMTLLSLSALLFILSLPIFSFISSLYSLYSYRFSYSFLNAASPPLLFPPLSIAPSPPSPVVRRRSCCSSRCRNHRMCVCVFSTHARVCCLWCCSLPSCRFAQRAIFFPGPVDVIRLSSFLFTALFNPLLFLVCFRRFIHLPHAVQHRAQAKLAGY